MALVICPECRSSISTNAPSCPHCGNPTAPTLSNEASSSGKRPHGWLLVTVFTFTFLSPARLIFNGVNDFLHLGSFNELYPHGWELALVITLSIRTMIAVYGVFAGVLLWRLRPTALTHSRHYLRATLGFGILWPMFWVMPLPGREAEFIISYCIGVFWTFSYFIAFWLYLKRSKQVIEAFSRQ